MIQTKKNSTIIILGLVMLVNALAYGTIIPLLYPYAARFGINALGLSFLFTSFSLAQFIATPIIGRLSDRYGRKPLLLICLFGSGLSLIGFALSVTAWQLFVSRIIDGITGGNISVAQAIIADSTEPKDRAKAFGILGGSFGFGFLAGPALGAFLSNYGLAAPFWFAAALAILGTIAGAFLLPETLSKSAEKEQRSEPLFRPQALVQALFTPSIGIILLISLLLISATNAWIISFQTFTVDTLKLATREIGILFSLFGLLSILMQMGGIRLLLRWFPSKQQILMGSLLLSTLAMGAFFFTETYAPYLVATIFFNVTGAPAGPMLAAILSERTKPEDQGAVMGINQSYTSLGQIVGPMLAGGLVAFGYPILIVPFGLMVVSLMAAARLFVPVRVKTDL